MTQKETLIKEIESLPPKLLGEVEDFIGYIKLKHRISQNNRKAKDITLASQEALAKDWLKPEEEEAWQDL